MTHAYRRRIAVTPDADGRPAAFDWRGVTYHPCAVLATWHLRDRWWEESAARTAASGPDGTGGGASDHTYYRLQCASASGRTELVCEVYHDAVGDRWVLERIYD